LASDLHPLTIIHGPPGTGKTVNLCVSLSQVFRNRFFLDYQTVLAAAILSAVANGERVLATAPSHAAVDALASAIIVRYLIVLFKGKILANILVLVILEPMAPRKMGRP